jgi:hypothetical protein
VGEELRLSKNCKESELSSREGAAIFLGEKYFAPLAGPSGSRVEKSSLPCSESMLCS